MLSTAACAEKSAPRIDPGGATVQCKQDCISVNKAFVVEHAYLFDELIRTKAALKVCQEKP